jgi:hypothetical protein
MRVFTCNHCARIHLEIGFLQIHFDSVADLEAYLRVLEGVDVPYYSAINARKGLRRGIILPLDAAGKMHLGFTVEEFEELKGVLRAYIMQREEKTEARARLADLQVIQWN